MFTYDTNPNCFSASSLLLKGFVARIASKLIIFIVITTCPCLINLALNKNYFIKIKIHAKMATTSETNVSAADLRSKSKYSALPVWQYFGFKADEDDKAEPTCKLCLKKISASGGNTSNLQRPSSCKGTRGRETNPQTLTTSNSARATINFPSILQNAKT